MHHKEVTKIAKRIARKVPKEYRETLVLDIVDFYYQGVSESNTVCAKLAEMNYGITKEEQFLVMARTFHRSAAEPRYSLIDPERPEEVGGEPS
jgi:hypothetical protein